jgi:hypothetical protein
MHIQKSYFAVVAFILAATVAQARDTTIETVGLGYGAQAEQAYTKALARAQTEAIDRCKFYEGKIDKEGKATVNCSPFDEGGDIPQSRTSCLVTLKVKCTIQEPGSGSINDGNPMKKADSESFLSLFAPSEGISAKRPAR